MLPKRKLIKKHRSVPKTSIEQTQIQSHQSLVDKLKSPNPSIKQQAITILANLRCVLPQFSEPEFLRQLINVLYQSTTSLCHESIFAMSNLCELEPKLISKLFQSGLDKALVSLPSTTEGLLKPILIFFITICEYLPQKYHYLLQGIRNSITVTHLKQNPELCLQFLVRTSAVASNKLSEPLLKEIAMIYQQSGKMVDKSYAVAVMARELLPNKQVEEMLINYMTELLLCIDLAKQYEMNFGVQTKHINPTKPTTPLNQQNNQIQQQQMQQENLQKNIKPSSSPIDKQKIKYFEQTVNGIEILMEFLLDALQQGQADDWEEQNEDQNENENENIDDQYKKSKTSSQFNNSELSHLILKFTQQNMSIFPKFLSLSLALVPNTENVLYLFYHLLVHIDKSLPSLPSTQQQINHLIQVSLENLFSSVSIQRTSQQYSLSFEQYEVFVQCLEIGLSLLLKNKTIGVNEDFLLNFSKQYMLDSTIFTTSKLLEQIKPSWLIMLELYSKKFNPQINQHITNEQNLVLGNILKHLIISIPYKQLQQFRCQVIDTLFDVYSNEKFDQFFVKMEFFQVLETIIKQGQTFINKQNKSKTKKNKKEKFVTDVLNDVKRFLQYKHKMIKN